MTSTPKVKGVWRSLCVHACVCVLIHWLLMHLRLTDGPFSQSLCLLHLETRKLRITCTSVSAPLCLYVCVCVLFSSLLGILPKELWWFPASLHGLITGTSCQRVGLPPSSPWRLLAPLNLTSSAVGHDALMGSIYLLKHDEHTAYQWQIAVTASL